MRYFLLTPSALIIDAVMTGGPSHDVREAPLDAAEVRQGQEEQDDRGGRGDRDGNPGECLSQERRPAAGDRPDHRVERVQESEASGDRVERVGDRAEKDPGLDQ